VGWTTSETEDWLRVEPSEGVLDPNDLIDVDVCITSDANLLDLNIYDQILTFENTDSGSIKLRSVTLTVKPPDCFTESFDANDDDLAFLSLSFSPDGTSAYYEACREKVTEFPTDPNGGTYVPLGDDDFAEVVLNNDANILFYGTRYDRFYIGSNGYITFGQGDTEFPASLENHFNMPRISPLFTDLTPADSQSISYKQLEDRVAVTFKDVPLYEDKTAKNSFQVEMFFVDGTIRVSWLDLAATSGIAGLSEGYGLPPSFLESDLSEYVPCWPLGDFNRDYYVDTSDLALFVSHWLDEDCGIPYWCGKTDLNFSKMVEMTDFAIFAENWLTVEDWWLQPASHWKFDEGQGNIAYDSVANNDGTIYGATWTTGRIDEALNFDGVDDYVKTLNNIFTNAQLAAGATLSAWFRTGSSSYGYIADDEGYLALGVNLSAHPNKLLATVDGGTHLYYSSSNVNDNLWHHVAIVWDGTNTAILYFDGVSESSGPSGPPTPDNKDRPFTIGAHFTISAYLNGKIDDVRAYDRTLSAEEIWQLYQQGLGHEAVNPNPANGATDVDPNTVLNWSPGKNALSHDVYFGVDFDDVNNATPDSNEYMGNYDVNTFDPCGLDLLTTYYWRIDEVNGPSVYKGDVWSFTTWSEFDPNIGLVSLWKFDEGSGTIAYDSVGDNDGTLVNGPIWTTGQIDGALSFDGVDDYVKTLNNIFTNAQLAAGATLTAWFKTGSSSYGFIADDEGYLNLGVNPAAHPNKLLATADGGTHIYYSTSNVNDNLWHHAAIVWNGTNTAILYFDGVSESSGSSGPPKPDSKSRPFTIGVHSTLSAYLNGIVDDVSVYDKALSAEEIWQLYQNGLNNQN
jgi:hypothetical protein